MCQNQYLADVLSTANFKRRKLNITKRPVGAVKQQPPSMSFQNWLLHRKRLYTS